MSILIRIVPYEIFCAIFTNFTINTASFFMKRRRCGFTTLSTYRRQLPGRARTRVPLIPTHTRDRPPCRGPPIA